ncbi:MAG: hypothetical protein ACI9MC_002064 [Kiritimatiellia bacterium]|jgi:hypothetical protein
MHRSWLTFAALSLLAGCGYSETGRLTATLLTSTCSWNGQEYLGVADFRVALEYTPTKLANRELPAVGTCNKQTYLFAEEAPISGGADIPKLDGAPAWSAQRHSGSLTNTEPGLYFDDVLGDAPGGCATPEEVVTEGVQLDHAGLFSGVVSPTPSPLGIVKIDGVRDDQWSGEVGYGKAMTVSWDENSWDETFVQVRQINGLNVLDVVTCNTTGTTSLAMDSAFWSDVDNMGTTKLEVYVGFQNIDAVQGTKGEALQTITRVAHVLKAPPPE